MIQRVTNLDAPEWKAMIAYAVHALHGNYQCSTRAYETSCFAAEHCQRNSTPSNIHDLFQSDYLYVASLPNYPFAGCVAALRQGDRLFLHSLCVHHELRDQKLGYKLVKTIQQLNSRLSLTVAKPIVSLNKEAGAHIQANVEKLFRFYKRLGFHLVEETSTHWCLET